MTTTASPRPKRDFEQLVENPGNLQGWHKYLDSIPVDGWGNPLHYKFPGSNGKDYDIISYGIDAREGGGDDITN